MTYSVVARHPETHELGVAVQSHYFSVGPTVPWAAPGIGAVATQASVNVSLGPHAIDQLESGATAAEAMERLLSADSGREHRQFAVVDANGTVAAHTGSECIFAAGHIVGDGVSCQANIMVTPEVWPAMLAAYERAISAGEPLAAALLDTLDAAEALGGDARGRQSAAILVVPSSGERWEKTLELRVEDHPDPLVELRRLYGIQQAYDLVSVADERIAGGDNDAAGELFGRALDLMPENHELRFWYGVHLYSTGAHDQGLELVRAAISAHPGWTDLLPRLSEQVAPGAAAVTAALGARR